MRSEKKKALQKKINRPRDQPKTVTTNSQIKMATTRTKIHLLLVEKMKKDKMVKTQKKVREMRSLMTTTKKTIKMEMETKNLATKMVLTIILTNKRKKIILAQLFLIQSDNILKSIMSKK